MRLDPRLFTQKQPRRELIRVGGSGRAGVGSKLPEFISSRIEK